jgi:hypothetical protein
MLLGGDAATQLKSASRSKIRRILPKENGKILLIFK